MKIWRCRNPRIRQEYNAAMTFLQAGLTVFSWLLALPVLMVFTVYIIEVIAGIPPGRTGSTKVAVPVSRRLRLAVLIPAHNEAIGIAATISKLQERIAVGTLILVVADNCTDDTAARARATGADVIERLDPAKRGKGYALAYGRDALAADPPDCVIVIDADCEMEAGCAESLFHTAMAKSSPVQAINLVRSEGTVPPVVQISNFAMIVKNLIRQRGMTRLGGAALLTGTGMAFPWHIFAKAPLASGDIAEDLGLGVALTRMGEVPRFDEKAQVWSAAAAQEDTLAQRTRWEHGFLTTASRYALPLLGSGLRQLALPSLCLGLHLLVPPLALLFVLGAAIILVIGIAGVLGGSWIPAICLFAAFVLATAFTVFGWMVEGQKALQLGALVRIPVYVLWKIPVYLKLMRGAEKQWVRTRRPGED